MIIFNLITIFLGDYYLIIFCIVYNKSHISLLIDYSISILEDIFIYFIIIIILRKLGFHFRNNYLYNTSKYINEYF